MDKLRRLIEDGNVEEARWERIRDAVECEDIPSAVADSGATSSCGKTGDPFHLTSVPSGKTFHMPDGGKASAGN